MDPDDWDDEGEGDEDAPGRILYGSPTWREDVRPTFGV